MTCDLRAVATGLYCQFTVHSFTVHSFGLSHEGIGENHQESVRGIGVEDSGGVEAERSFEEKPYGEVVPRGGIEIPELHDVYDSTEHVEDINQKEVEDEGDEESPVDFR